jgi:hypothetical protein
LGTARGTPLATQQQLLAKGVQHLACGVLLAGMLAQGGVMRPLLSGAGRQALQGPSRLGFLLLLFLLLLLVLLFALLLLLLPLLAFLLLLLLLLLCGSRANRQEQLPWWELTLWGLAW